MKTLTCTALLLGAALALPAQAHDSTHATLLFGHGPLQLGIDLGHLAAHHPPPAYRHHRYQRRHAHRGHDRPWGYERHRGHRHHPRHGQHRAWSGPRDHRGHYRDQHRHGDHCYLGYPRNHAHWKH